MERDHNITSSAFTNFLMCGALLRKGDRWILLEGPFRSGFPENKADWAVFCPQFYDLEAARPLKGVQTFVVTPQELKKNCEDYLAKTAPHLSPFAQVQWEAPLKGDFNAAFEEVKKQIREGRIHKAVPTVFERMGHIPTLAERAFFILRLISSPPSLHIYGFWQEESGILGATPEVLVEYSQGHIKTMALAGTCPKGEASHRLSLLDDAKEMAEHQYVLEDLKAIMEKKGSLSMKGPEIVELPTLFHLKTDINVSCEGQPDFLQLIAELHPTPALGVAPRAAGYHWMRTLPDQEDRGRFGAPFAFMNQEMLLCLVAIRNLQWNRTHSLIGAGCGVVAASELEREWRELSFKRQSVKKILGIEL